MKKKILIVAAIVLAIVAAICTAIVISNNDNNKSGKLKSVSDVKTMFNSIYEDLGDELPSLETESVDASDENLVTTYTGLKSNKYVAELIVSEPFINAQAYSAVVVIAKDGANIEDMKKEMLDNINMNKWVCVSAGKLYITNSGNVIFLIMSDDDWAKPVYEGFKKYVDNKVGKELEKTNELQDIELPSEMIVE